MWKVFWQRCQLDNETFCLYEDMYILNMSVDKIDG